jgi:hypothetical protein
MNLAVGNVRYVIAFGTLLILMENARHAGKFMWIHNVAVGKVAVVK